jgi:endoglucanase
MRTPTPGPATRSAHLRLALVATTFVALLAALTPTMATPAQATTRNNPLAGHAWGIDTHDVLAKAYTAATGTNKKLLGKMALRPRSFWFTDKVPPYLVTRRIRDYVAMSQAGDRDALVQLAVFRLWPEGEAARNKPLTVAQRKAYRRWVRKAARGIGSARVALLLEPDLAVSLKGWRPAVRLGLARYAVRVFSALPRTTVYLDAGASDWLTVPMAVSMLRRAGIKYVRGFSLGATHYTSAAAEIAYGTQIVTALRRAGLPRKHFVVDTSDNGRPFTWNQYWADHPRGDFDNAEHCLTRTQRRCVTLGIPPTTAVAAPRRGLSLQRRKQAQANVDAFMWFSRPWFVYAYPAYFSLPRALAVARTTPY